MNKTDQNFDYEFIDKGININLNIESPGEKLLPLNPNNLSILQKVDSFVEKFKLHFLHKNILSQKLFAIESNFIEDNPDKAVLLNSVKDIDFSRQIKILTNDKAGKAGRARWFVIDRNIIKVNEKYIGEWQVVVSSANAGGQKRDRQLEIIDNHSAFGRSRVALASFKTKAEAKIFMIMWKAIL